MTDCGCELKDAEALERKALRALLGINGVMFFAVALAGYWGDSTALLADSLDNLADASVFGIALYTVGRTRRLKANVAILSGVLLVALGSGIFIEAVRRFFYGSDPVSTVMMAAGAASLVANVTCVMLIAGHRKGDIHMRASWIFATNDVIANLGVIVSGALVVLLGSRFPDLVIGAVISVVVLYGGVKILREGHAARKLAHQRSG